MCLKSIQYHCALTCRLLFQECYKAGIKNIFITKTNRSLAHQKPRVPGQIIHYGMDMENGTLVYEIFILTSQNKIYEVEVNAKIGVIRKIEEENDSD